MVNYSVEENHRDSQALFDMFHSIKARSNVFHSTAVLPSVAAQRLTLLTSGLSCSCYCTRQRSSLRWWLWTCRSVWYGGGGEEREVGLYRGVCSGCPFLFWGNLQCCGERLDSRMIMLSSIACFASLDLIVLRFALSFLSLFGMNTGQAWSYSSCYLSFLSAKDKTNRRCPILSDRLSLLGMELRLWW